MRILVTLRQDSPELLAIALYCRTHGIDLRKECWHLDQKDYEFHLIYTDDHAHMNWLYMAYPSCFFEF